MNLEDMYLTFHNAEGKFFNCTSFVSATVDVASCSLEEIKMYEELKNGKVHAKLLLREMLKDCAEHYKFNFLPWSLLLAVCHAIIPFVIRGAYGEFIFGNKESDTFVRK